MTTEITPRLLEEITRRAEYYFLNIPVVSHDSDRLTVHRIKEEGTPAVRLYYRSRVFSNKYPEITRLGLIFDPFGKEILREYLHVAEDYRRLGFGELMTVASHNFFKSLGFKEVKAVMPLPDAYDFWVAQGYKPREDGELVKKLD